MAEPAGTEDPANGGNNSGDAAEKPNATSSAPRDESLEPVVAGTGEKQPVEEGQDQDEKPSHDEQGCAHNPSRAEQEGGGGRPDARGHGQSKQGERDSGWGKLISNDAEVSPKPSWAHFACITHKHALPVQIPSVLVCGKSAALGKGMLCGHQKHESEKGLAFLEPGKNGVTLRVTSDSYLVLQNNVALQCGAKSPVQDGDEITLRGRRAFSYVRASSSSLSLIYHRLVGDHHGNQINPVFSFGIALL